MSSYKIEIQPAGIKFSSIENLLEDALSQSIPLEHSCKMGDCGACSAEVLSGTVENEHGVLVTEGVILTCKSKAKTDVMLKANYYPELISIKQQTIPCKVASYSFVTEDIVSITFRYPPTAKFDYLSGQYVDLSFNGIKRSYSIANAKTESKELELHIRKVPNGKMSELIFSQLKENQLMRLEGPKGTFFVRDGNNPLILIATGTGIAPIKAIVEELLLKGDNRELYIYWGMQFAKELYCHELIELAKTHEHIKFTAALSREVTDEHFNGYVQDAVKNDFPSLSHVEVYACGSLKMINEAKIAFSNLHLPLDAFFADAFTPSK